MTFERTFDMTLVRWVLTYRTVWPHLVDDFHPPIEKFFPCDHPEIWYITVRDRDELLGLWMLVPENGICYEAHTALLPGHGYRRARRAARELAGWVWEHLPHCERLVAKIPAYNYWALRFTRDVGFVEFGRNERSYRKHGISHTTVLLGLSRPALDVAQEKELAA